MNILMILYHLVAGACARAFEPVTRSALLAWVRANPVHAASVAFLTGLAVSSLIGCVP